MANKPIRRIAIIGTGVIGASWAALYLAKGCTSSRRISRRTRKPPWEVRGRRMAGAQRWASRPARPVEL